MIFMAELDSGIAGEQCKIQKILFMENKNTTHIVSDIQYLITYMCASLICHSFGFQNAIKDSLICHTPEAAKSPQKITPADVLRLSAPAKCSAPQSLSDCIRRIFG